MLAGGHGADGLEDEGHVVGVHVLEAAHGAETEKLEAAHVRSERDGGTHGRVAEGGAGDVRIEGPLVVGREAEEGGHLVGNDDGEWGG